MKANRQQGDDGMKEFQSRVSKKSIGKGSEDLENSEEDSAWRKRFQIYFPSRNTVLRSIGGPSVRVETGFSGPLKSKHIVCR